MGDLLISLLVKVRYILAFSFSGTGMSWGDLNQPKAFSMGFTSLFVSHNKVATFLAGRIEGRIWNYNAVY